MLLVKTNEQSKYNNIFGWFFGDDFDGGWLDSLLHIDK